MNPMQIIKQKTIYTWTSKNRLAVTLGQYLAKHCVKIEKMKKDIKEELIKIMAPIFGEEVKKLIESNYDSNKPGELLELAEHMLTGYMGAENADRILKKLNLELNKPQEVEIK